MCVRRMAHAMVSSIMRHLGETRLEHSLSTSGLMTDPRMSTVMSVSWWVNQSLNQSVSQPVSPSVCQSLSLWQTSGCLQWCLWSGELVSHLISPSVSQSVPQSVNLWPYDRPQNVCIDVCDLVSLSVCQPLLALQQTSACLQWCLRYGGLVSPSVSLSISQPVNLLPYDRPQDVCSDISSLVECPTTIPGLFFSTKKAKLCSSYSLFRRSVCRSLTLW